MDKKTARQIADGLTWARIWSAIPMARQTWLAHAVLVIGTLSKVQLLWHLAIRNKLGGAEQATESSGAR